MAASGAPQANEGGSPSTRNLPLAGVTALGIVYGDLGTSPLYTLQTVVQATGGRLSEPAALGVLSLIFWTLILTVTVKYCLFVMRADNYGEGGILALMSLVGANRWGNGAYIGAAMGLLGAALIYGDGVITPSISVLSALEGVNIVTPALKPFVLPAAVAILVALFGVQRFGTARIGRAFGPVMLVWFLVIATLGLMGVARHPAVLAAVNPLYALEFLAHSKAATALLVLGGVFLCATGGEALYADMGHIGRTPIRIAWGLIVLPALLLSYAGQIAVLIDGRAATATNPFFLLAPAWGVYPLVALATLATIIASQAIITGAFSMTRQAMQLGWLPLFQVRQTSRETYGQIYVPTVNWIMAGATIAITLAFRSSDKLAGAYGMAVSTTMLLTTMLLYRAMSGVWRWPRSLALALSALFLLVDGGFFVANLLKLWDGGWIPLSLGILIFLLMATWRSGMQTVRARLQSEVKPVADFLAELETAKVARVPGVAVFLTRVGKEVPPFMADYVRLIGSLPQTVVALSMHFDAKPRIAEAERGAFNELHPGFWQVELRYGFMENPDISSALKRLPGLCTGLDLADAVFFGARDFVTRGPHPVMGRFRTGLFAFMFRNGVRITDRFNLPPGRTLEIAREIEI